MGGAVLSVAGGVVLSVGGVAVSSTGGAGCVSAGAGVGALVESAGGAESGDMTPSSFLWHADSSNVSAAAKGRIVRFIERSSSFRNDVRIVRSRM
jgi:hypothetical protein